MTREQRDKRALLLLAVVVPVLLAILFWPSGDGAAAPAAKATATSIPMAERRIAQLREVVATVPGKQKMADTLAGQLSEQEKNLLAGQTAAQAQANLLQILRRLARAQAPPIDIGQVEMGLVRGLGKEYGETLVSVNMNCRIEQLVQLLADLTAQPELIATEEIRVNAGDPKQKLVSVRLTVSGMLPRRMVPERRGTSLF